MAAIYQWFVNNDTPESFVDYEYLMFATDQNYLVRLIGLDYLGNTYTDFGSWYAGGTPSIVVDPNGDAVIQSTGTAGLYGMYTWRGTCFTSAHWEDVGGSLNNPSKGIQFIGNLDQKFLDCGCLSFGHGFALINYDPNFAGTMSLSIQQTRTAPEDFWYQGSDFRVGSNRFKPGYGDLVLLYGGAAYLVTYKSNGSTLQEQYVSPYQPTITGHDVGWDRDDGWWAYQSGTGVQLYKVDMDDYSISSIGYCDCDTGGLSVFAVQPVPGSDGNIILTSQSAGATHRLRTYSRVGTTLTLLDDVAQITNNTNPNVRFEVSPYSGRIWLHGIGGQGTVYVTVDLDTGAIAQPYALPYGTNSSGGTGRKSMAFLKNPLTEWTNGYTGIKQRLYGAWEMNETSGDRLQAFTDINASQRDFVPYGTVSYVASDVGNAAQFSGAGGLRITNAPSELGTTGTFGVCLDVRLDSKASTQTIMCRARDEWYWGVNPDHGDWRLGYSASQDKFFFQTLWGNTYYTVWADDVGPIVLGTKYHIYFEFHKRQAKNKIQVNYGTLYEADNPIHINRYPFSCIMLGMRTTWATLQEYMSGSVNQLFYFWYDLDGTQRSFMYNDGASRTFAEL